MEDRRTVGSTDQGEIIYRRITIKGYVFILTLIHPIARRESYCVYCGALYHQQGRGKLILIWGKREIGHIVL